MAKDKEPFQPSSTPPPATTGFTPHPETKPEPKKDRPLVEVPPDRREPDAPLVKLVQPKPQGDEQPRDLPPPSPPKADPHGPVPRLVHENERSPDYPRLKRYKVWCRTGGTYPARYVLASSEEEARAYFLQSTGIEYDLATAQRRAQLVAWETFPEDKDATARQRLEMAHLEKIPRPDVHVKALAD